MTRLRRKFSPISYTKEKDYAQTYACHYFISKRYNLHSSVVRSVCLRALSEVPDLNQIVNLAVNLEPA